MSYDWSSPKRPPSIILSFGHLLIELLLVSDQLKVRPLFRISELVAYESFDCIILRSCLFEVVF